VKKLGNFCNEIRFFASIVVETLITWNHVEKRLVSKKKKVRPLSSISIKPPFAGIGSAGALGGAANSGKRLAADFGVIL